MKMRKLPSQETLLHWLDYNLDTGIFRWKTSPHPRVPVGTLAGSPDHKRYLKVSIRKVAYLCNRLAWMYVYGVDPGDMQVDHKNGNRQDNRIDNLRLATNAQNCQNRPSGAQQASSASGIKGVTYHTRTRKWRLRVQIQGKRVSLGLFDTKQEAAAVAEAKRRELHGEFANHG